MADVTSMSHLELIAELNRLHDENKALRAQYDVDDDAPAMDEDGAVLCAVCGEASVRVKRRGSRWVCWGCWEEDVEA